MCCLFGFVDYGHKLSRKQRSKLLTALSIASEERGTDATGIAYNSGGRLHIFKRPIPAHLMWYRVPKESTAVMGHTRMTTQGSEKRNKNNHPFHGTACGTSFALAHNGVIFNDKSLRKNYKLPATKVETDSYVAVQLLEQCGMVEFDSLRFVAEQLEGTFTITVLSAKDELYFIKGNNPMCIWHYPESGLYVYASTMEILQRAMLRTRLRLGKQESIWLYSGEILCIDSHGKITRSHFDDNRLYASLSPFETHWSDWPSYDPDYPCAENTEYIRDLKAVAACCGLYPEDVDSLLADGVPAEEIEEYLYCR